MNELRIIRGAEIGIFADDTPLFGVTALSAVQKNRFHEVHEYGASAPCAYVGQTAGVVIQLSVLTIFDHQFSREEGFSLKIKDGDDVYCYDHCRIIERKAELKGNSPATKTIVIEADMMRKEATA